MTRLPRAKIGQGGYAPSLGLNDPRIRRRLNPVVRQDVPGGREIQELEKLSELATTEQIVVALNQVVDSLRGDGE